MSRSLGLRPCVESVPEPGDSSPVLTWILGYFWSLPRGVSPRLEWGHARALFSRDVSVYSRETNFPCTASTFKPRINSHHGGTWDSPVENPRGKASRESHISIDPRDGKRHIAVTAQEESARACPHLRRGLTPLWRLQKYPKIHVITEEECSGSGTDSTQGLRPRHRLERNPERPPSSYQGD